MDCLTHAVFVRDRGHNSDVGVACSDDDVDEVITEQAVAATRQVLQRESSVASRLNHQEHERGV